MEYLKGVKRVQKRFRIQDSKGLHTQHLIGFYTQDLKGFCTEDSKGFHI